MSEEGDGFYWIAALVIVIVIVLGVMGFTRAQSDCDAKGGALVKGTVGYVCVTSAH